MQQPLLAKRFSDGSVNTSTSSTTFGASLNDVTLTPTGTASSTGGDLTNPNWWSTINTPYIWMSYTSSGTGTIRGGLTTGTRYLLNVNRVLGISSPAAVVSTRDFVVSFYDVETGGTSLGSKTITVTADNN